MKFSWKGEVNPNGEPQLVARLAGELVQAGSNLIESKSGGKPYHLNTLRVKDADGNTEVITALFYPGDKNKLENLEKGLPYLTRAILNKGAKSILFVTSALVSGNTVSNTMSDAEFDRLFAEVEANAGEASL
jgi:hypothetical protein